MGRIFLSDLFHEVLGLLPRVFLLLNQRFELSDHGFAALIKQIHLTFQDKGSGLESLQEGFIGLFLRQ
jgi:hypothetical protein